MERMQEKLGLSRSQVYRLIEAKVRTAHLPRHIAAIAVASERGINISKFASHDDLAMIRQGAPSSQAQPVSGREPEPPSARRLKRDGRRKAGRAPRGNQV